MKTFEDGVRAIREMEVRGAPLIGVTAAFALYVGIRGQGRGPGGIRGKGRDPDFRRDDKCSQGPPTRNLQPKKKATPKGSPFHEKTLYYSTITICLVCTKLPALIV
jgi:hypothetical protein